MWHSAVRVMVTLTLSILVVLRAAAAQPLVQSPRIGFLSTGRPTPCANSYSTFLQALHERGYVEGQTISITWRCAEGKTDVAHQLAEELVQLRVDVIVSHGLAGSLAAKAATSTIPILFVGVGDPVASGLVPSLARPRGNVTGVTNIVDFAFFAKHLELLREAVPAVTHVALLLSAGDPFNANKITPVETAARAVGITLHLVEVEVPHGFEAAFATMTRQGVGALLVSFTPSLGPHLPQIATLAARHRLAAIDQSRIFAQRGGLHVLRHEFCPSLAAGGRVPGAHPTQAPNPLTCPWSCPPNTSSSSTSKRPRPSGSRSLRRFSYRRTR